MLLFHIPCDFCECYAMVMEMKTKLVVRWLEDELMRILRFFVVGVA